MSEVMLSTLKAVTSMAADFHYTTTAVSTILVTARPFLTTANSISVLASSIAILLFRTEETTRGSLRATCVSLGAPFESNAVEMDTVAISQVVTAIEIAARPDENLDLLSVVGFAACSLNVHIAQNLKGYLSCPELDGRENRFSPPPPPCPIENFDFLHVVDVADSALSVRNT